MLKWLLIVALSFGFGGCSLVCGIDVVVVNEGATPVTDLTVSYSGGRELVRELWPGETLELSISPKGESDLVINFVDASGQTRGGKINVHFSHDDRGRIDIRLDKAGKVLSNYKITSCVSLN